MSRTTQRDRDLVRLVRDYFSKAFTPGVIADVERDRLAARSATGLVKCCASLESTVVGVRAPIWVALAVELPPTIDQMELAGLGDSDDVRRELTAEHPDLCPNPSLGQQLEVAPPPRSPERGAGAVFQPSQSHRAYSSR